MGTRRFRRLRLPRRPRDGMGRAPRRLSQRLQPAPLEGRRHASAHGRTLARLRAVLPAGRKDAHLQLHGGRGAHHRGGRTTARRPHPRRLRDGRRHARGADVRIAPDRRRATVHFARRALPRLGAHRCVPRQLVDRGGARVRPRRVLPPHAAGDAGLRATLAAERAVPRLHGVPRRRSGMVRLPARRRAEGNAPSRRGRESVRVTGRQDAPLRPRRPAPDHRLRRRARGCARLPAAAA